MTDPGLAADILRMPASVINSVNARSWFLDFEIDVQFI
jgi:hypothetical protein